MYMQCAIYKIFGLMQEKFSAEWDDKLNDLLDHGEIVKINNHTVSISHKGKMYQVWIANKPYSYATPYKVDCDSVKKNAQVRPKIKKMIRLDNMTKDILKQQSEIDKIWK